MDRLMDDVKRGMRQIKALMIAQLLLNIASLAGVMFALGRVW